MNDILTSKDLVNAGRMLGSQERNLLTVLSAKGILQLAEKIPDGSSIISIFSEIKDSGNSKLPDIQKSIYAEAVVCSLIMSRYAFAASTKILSDMDFDDVTEVGKQRLKAYGLLVATYGKSFDALAKALRSLGYEGETQCPTSLAEKVLEMIEKDSASQDHRESHEETIHINNGQNNLPKM